MLREATKITELDILRCTSVESRQSVKKQRQEELQQIIIDVLRKHPKLAYYQVLTWMNRLKRGSYHSIYSTQSPPL